MASQDFKQYLLELGVWFDITVTPSSKTANVKEKMIIQNLYRQYFKVFSNPMTSNLGRKETDLEIYIKQHAICD